MLTIPKIRRLSLLGMIGITLCGVTRPAPAATPLARATGEFAADLYRDLATRSGNLIFSPASVHTALAMTLAGARGKTAEELARVLHTTELGKAGAAGLDANEKELLHYLMEGPHPYQLVMANSFWGQKNFPFLPAFVSLLKESYESQVSSTDFKSNPDAARKEINLWVAKATQNKIEDLLPSGVVTRETLLVLVNAIYFKAPWQHPFVPTLTVREPFFVDEKKKVSVPLMKQKEAFSYYEDAEVQMVDLPYKGRSLAMTVLLPRARAGLPALEKSAASEGKLDGWLKQLKPRQVNLALPKFQFSTDFKLSDVLSKLGVKQAFSAQADFSGMSSAKGLALSEVMHKAFIDVNEKGTEAAASSASLTFGSALMGPPPAVFVADHPFLFVIRDLKTEVPLFWGRVADPSVASAARAE